MKWISARVAFDAKDPDSAAAMIAEIFNELGLQGVIVETPDEDPDLDWAEDALAAPENCSVTGFFPEDGRLASNKKKLEQSLARIYRGAGLWYRVEYSDVDDQDWAESWKTHFHPVRISEQMVVKPTWRQYTRQEGEILIELDPGMAFGTGTHPTTAMCLRLIERHMQPGFRIIDIGTGSGILLIAAAKLGATELAGIDSDPVAVGVAEENLRLNGIDKARFRIKTGNLADSVTGTYDMAAANILTTAVVSMIPEIPRLLREGGIFIASGILAENSGRVTAALKEHGFGVLEILTEDQWAGIAAKKSGTPYRNNF
ncbi:MAG: 50S ribosomal protein L11 methyltransferase [Desulfobacterales bacterium]|nr:50S ribosomal protein L11 methyltransferase [Desulfobacterales bacterium]